MTDADTSTPVAVAAEVRAAKKWLERHGHTGTIGPRTFANFCKEMDLGFKDAYPILVDALELHDQVENKK